MPVLRVDSYDNKSENKPNRLLGCLFLDITEQFSSVVTWQHFPQYVHDSVSNVPYLPAVNQRIQSRTNKRQRQSVT